MLTSLIGALGVPLSASAVNGDSVVVGAPATNANRPDDKGAACVVSRATTTDSNAQRCIYAVHVTLRIVWLASSRV